VGKGNAIIGQARASGLFPLLRSQRPVYCLKNERTAGSFVLTSNRRVFERYVSQRLITQNQKFKTIAKDTHNAYGNVIQPAGRSILLKIQNIAQTNGHNKRITANPAAMDCRPKKEGVHIPLRVNWTAKSTMAIFFQPAISATKILAQAQPISAYKIIHTGPKIQFGGAMEGKLSDPYQCQVASDFMLQVPAKPTSSHIATQAKGNNQRYETG
jgi:hypothetical protein